MAITWGGWRNNRSGNGMRLGYKLSQSPSRVGTGTSSVTVRLEVWVQTKASVYDSTNSFRISGHYSTSGSKNITTGTTKLYNSTRRVSTKYGTSTKIHFSSSLSGINAIPGTVSVSGHTYVGARPISPPLAPKNLKVTRSSDTRQALHWTNTSPTSAARPYQKIQVQRWDNEGASWRTIATLSGSATSYGNTNTRKNLKYKYAVRAVNSAGNSAVTKSEFIATAPYTPKHIKATKSGNDIKLTWTNGASVAGGADAILIYRSNDGVWEPGNIKTLSGTPTSYTDPNPDPTKTHSYKARTRSSEYAGGTLYSVYADPSNTVQLLTEPAAPTGLSPSSAVRDTDFDIGLKWQHNSVDTTPQKAYEIQYRIDGGEWVSLHKTASGSSSRTIPAELWPNGVSVEWQVRTWGDYVNGSPWSKGAVIETSQTPGATVEFPVDVLNTSRVTVEWNYFDAEETAQTEYKVRLYSEGGDEVLEDYDGVGPETSHAFTKVLKNNGHYRVGVSVRDGSGLWSDGDYSDFIVEYLLPPVPVISVEWDEDLGAVHVTPDSAAPSENEDETDHVEIWRSVDWKTYDLIADNVEPNTTITDYIPAIGTENVYLVIAVTSIGAVAESEPFVYAVPTAGSWWWFNGGEAFSEMVRVRYNPSRARTFKRDKALNQYAGRRYPVETAGESRENEISLDFALLGEDDATVEALEEVVDLPAPICFRAPTGDRRYVSLDSSSTSGTSDSHESVGLTMNQVAAPDSGSMALDPVVYRTNFNPDPRALDPANYRATGDLSIVDVEGDSALAVLENADGGACYVDPNHNFMVADLGIVEGDILNTSVDVMVTTPLRIRVRTSAYEGAELSDYPGYIDVIPDDGWVRLTGAQEVVDTGATETTNDGYFRVLVWPAERDLPAGEGFYVKDWIIAVNDDGPYFDGDTVPDSGAVDYDTAWTGEPDNSPSVLTRGGKS